MEMHDVKDCYCFKTKKGTRKVIAKIPEIENAVKSTLDSMTDIGKITDLFWGFNIVDHTGLIMRKFKFMTLYPSIAQRVIKNIYPEFFHMSDRGQDIFRHERLNDRMKEIGFSIVGTKALR